MDNMSSIYQYLPGYQGRYKVLFCTYINTSATHAASFLLYIHPSLGLAP